MAVNSTLDCLQWIIADRPRFWRMVFGRIIDVQPKLIIPDLSAIRQAVESEFGFSVLPDYLCADWVK
jgi:DNA-binding transcriptional LysR family regulator